MTEKEEEQFLSSSICWIWKKLIEYEKVRDHCHITGKFRGAAIGHVTKKVPVMFHNLRGYDSHLIFYELKKFDVKIQEFSSKNVELLKQKDAYPYQYTNSF